MSSGIGVVLARVRGGANEMPGCEFALRYVGTVDAVGARGEEMLVPWTETIRVDLVLLQGSADFVVGTATIPAPQGFSSTTRRVQMDPVESEERVTAELRLRLLRPAEVPDSFAAADPPIVEPAPRDDAGSAQAPELLSALRNFQFCPPCVPVDWHKVAAVDVDDVRGRPSGHEKLKHIIGDVAFGIGSAQPGLRVHPCHLKTFRGLQLATQYLLASTELLNNKVRHAEEALEGMQRLQRGAQRTAEEQCVQLRELRREREALLGVEATYMKFDAARNR